jgi:hypothetical protein
MKRLLLVVMAGACLPAGMVQADRDGTVVGAVVGTAAGLIIANNTHGVNPWVAAPVGALVGGYIGSRYDRRAAYNENDDWRYRYDDDPYYRRGDDRRHHRDDRDYGRPRDRGYVPHSAPAAVVLEKPEAGPLRSTQATDNPHPGVDLIKVSIMNSNGVRTDVPILRTKGKFVGPQGEEYETLPTAEQLAKRYGM